MSQRTKEYEAAVGEKKVNGIIDQADEAGALSEMARLAESVIGQSVTRAKLLKLLFSPKSDSELLRDDVLSFLDLQREYYMLDAFFTSSGLPPLITDEEKRLVQSTTKKWELLDGPFTKNTP